MIKSRWLLCTSDDWDVFYLLLLILLLFVLFSRVLGQTKKAMQRLLSDVIISTFASHIHDCEPKDKSWCLLEVLREMAQDTNTVWSVWNSVLHKNAEIEKICGIVLKKYSIAFSHPVHWNILRLSFFSIVLVPSLTSDGYGTCELQYFSASFFPLSLTILWRIPLLGHLVQIGQQTYLVPQLLNVRQPAAPQLTISHLVGAAPGQAVVTCAATGGGPGAGGVSDVSSGFQQVFCVFRVVCKPYHWKNKVKCIKRFLFWNVLIYSTKGDMCQPVVFN